MNAKLSNFVIPSHIFWLRIAKEDRTRVHLPLRNALLLYFYQRAISTTAVSSSSLSVVVIVVAILLSALVAIALYICAFQRSLLSSTFVFVLVGCVAYLLLFLIFLHFLFFFFLLSHTRAVPQFLYHTLAL